MPAPRKKGRDPAGRSVLASRWISRPSSSSERPSGRVQPSLEPDGFGNGLEERVQAVRADDLQHFSLFFRRILDIGHDYGFLRKGFSKRTDVGKATRSSSRRSVRKRSGWCRRRWDRDRRRLRRAGGPVVGPFNVKGGLDPRPFLSRIRLGRGAVGPARKAGGINPRLRRRGHHHRRRRPPSRPGPRNPRGSGGISNSEASSALILTNQPSL